MKKNINKSDKGVALITTVVLLFAVMIIVLTGAQLISTSFKETKFHQNFVAEAENVARAGLVDTVSWFRRQGDVVRSGVPPTNPTWEDGAFHPIQIDTDAVHSATIDESIGLVKEYQLNEARTKWARYEIKRQQDTPDIDPLAVHDITHQRVPNHQKGEGLAWSIVSTGYVYRKISIGKFTSPPDVIISKARVSTEIRRINLNNPACAVAVYDGGSGGTYNVKVNKNGRILGGNNGIGCARYSGDNAPSVDSNGILSGLPQSDTTSNDLSVISIFGVSELELKSMADRYDVTVTTPMPDMSLIYIDGNATFDVSKPLRSSGILYIKGDLTIAELSNSLYSGLIYVTGDATIGTPCLIMGCLIVKGKLSLSSSGATDVAEICYDSQILVDVRNRVCQYRENKSISHSFKPMTGL